MTDHEAVADHYARDGLAARVRDALSAAGLDGGRLSPADLASLDQFHSRGLAATVELAEALDPAPDDDVIDIGSGLGGPSRYLAATFGCRVIGIDLSASYVEAARLLSERCGLSEKVSYRCADALSLPFEDGRFDLAWTQHVAMNIADRGRLYAEAYRVLRPGGRFAIYDVVAGSGDIHFPVPWSRGPRTSYLLDPEAMRAALETQGFRVLSWREPNAAGKAWFAAMRQARATASATPPALGLHLAMGRDFGEMAANLGRNLEEGRVGLVEAIVARS